MITKLFGSLIYSGFIVVILSRKTFATTDEDQFVQQYGNDPNNTRAWPEIKSYFNEAGHLKLKKFIAGVQKKISSAWEQVYFDVEEPVYKKSMLKFQNTQYHPKRVEVLGYKINVKQARKAGIDTPKSGRWFVTQGLKKECVYFLKLLNSDTDQLWEFNLDKHLCGMRSKF